VADYDRKTRSWLGALLSASVLVACTQQTPQQQTTGANSLVSLKEGVPIIATALVSGAKLPPPPPSGRYPVVIDPWIDVSTGSQVATTKLMQQELETLAPQHFPQLELLPFTQESLARKPLVILGAIAPVSGPDGLDPVAGSPGAYHVYGVLADLSTGKIASTAGGWVQEQDIDTTPTAFYRDSPVWEGDESVAAYLRTLRARPGDPIDAAYLQNLQAEALITAGNADYGEGNYRQARSLYSDAASLPAGGHQLRVYNGLYLTNWALGDRRSATEVFSQMVDYQLTHGQLSIKFLFRPGSTAFWPDPAISGAYPYWLQVIAHRIDVSRTCLHLTGHTSPTGSAKQNDRLSAARAERIRQELLRLDPRLPRQITASGAGSRYAIVDTGRDDATDLVDRRVDFTIVPCEPIA
jgi:outer membrane protein OmpA-like peptidoglycan-associated protein